MNDNHENTTGNYNSPQLSQKDLYLKTKQYSRDGRWEDLKNLYLPETEQKESEQEPSKPIESQQLEKAINESDWDSLLELTEEETITDEDKAQGIKLDLGDDSIKEEKRKAIESLQHLECVLKSDNQIEKQKSFAEIYKIVFTIDDSEDNIDPDNNAKSNLNQLIKSFAKANKVRSNKVAADFWMSNEEQLLNLNQKYEDKLKKEVGDPWKIIKDFVREEFLKKKFVYQQKMLEAIKNTEENGVALMKKEFDSWSDEYCTAMENDTKKLVELCKSWGGQKKWDEFLDLFLNQDTIEKKLKAEFKKEAQKYLRLRSTFNQMMIRDSSKSLKKTILNSIFDQNETQKKNKFIKSPITLQLINSSGFGETSSEERDRLFDNLPFETYQKLANSSAINYDDKHFPATFGPKDPMFLKDFNQNAALYHISKRGELNLNQCVEIVLNSMDDNSDDMQNAIDTISKHIYNPETNVLYFDRAKKVFKMILKNIDHCPSINSDDEIHDGENRSQVFGATELDMHATYLIKLIAKNDNVNVIADKYGWVIYNILENRKGMRIFL